MCAIRGSKRADEASSDSNQLRVAPLSIFFPFPEAFCARIPAQFRTAFSTVYCQLPRTLTWPKQAATSPKFWSASKSSAVTSSFRPRRSPGKPAPEFQDALVELGYCTAQDVTCAIAEQHGLQFIDLTEVTIPQTVIELVPESLARERRPAHGPRERGASRS